MTIQHRKREQLAHRIFQHRYFHLLLVMMLCYSARVSYSQNLENYFEQYRQGTINQSSFTYQLLNAAHQAPQAQDSIRILEKYRPHVDNTHSADVNLSIARYYELMKDYSNAIQNYQHYLRHTENNSAPYFSILIRIAHLYLEIGEHNLALEIVSKVYNSATDTTTKEQAIILLARTEKLQGKLKNARDRLNALTTKYPNSRYIRAAYLLLYDIQRIMNDHEGAASTQVELMRRFPNSIENNIVKAEKENSNVLLSPSFAEIVVNTEDNLIENNPPQLQLNNLVAIQAGSFTKKVNATKFQEQLSGRYTTKIIEREINDTTYYQVRIYVLPSQSTQALASLKSDNIVGFVIEENAPLH